MIVAGTREDIDALDGDMAETMRDLLVLIDRYDLYGRVAYPKTHRPEDVPAIYAYARDRGGVFVNPALNEPFGLTLLEASAAGLPLVATDSGGPNDIVETCGNGLLVDPRAPGAIAAACLRILGDPALYARCVAGGARAARPTIGTGTPRATTGCCAISWPRDPSRRRRGSSSSAISTTR